MRISLALAAFVLAFADLRAQEAVRTPAQPAAPAHDIMVLIGCLGPGPDPSTFKLTNVQPKKDVTDSQPVGTSGRVEYELKAEARLDAPSVAPPELKGLVGHEVEITARPVPKIAEDGAKAAAEGGADAAAVKPADPKIEKLTVTAIKQVFATCR
jgi:hypothetical protein